METGLTVREILTEADLGFSLLTGDTGLDRIIEAVHHSDLDDPTPWMIDGTLLITHGAPFAEPTRGAEYLDRVSQKTVALVVAVGSHIDQLSAKHVDHARSLGLPVFEVPPTVAIRTIFSYVYHALASSDMHRLRRALAVHSQLLDLLIEDKGIGEVIRRLSSSLNMGLVLFNGTGKVIASAGCSDPFDPEALWRIYLDSADNWGPRDILEAEHGHIQIRRVAVHGSVERILADVASSPRDELADMALSYAQRVFALDLVREREQAIYRRRVRSSLLHDFLSREDDAREYVELLRAQDIDVGQPWRLLIFGSTSLLTNQQNSYQSRTHKARPTAVHFSLDMSTEIDSIFAQRGIPTISAVEGECIVVLAVFGDMTPEAVRDAVSDVLGAIDSTYEEIGLCVGISSQRIGPSFPAAPLRQAQESLRSIAEGVGATERIVVFDHVSGRYHVLEGQSVEVLTAMEGRLVAPLEEYDRKHHTALVATLRAFLENRMSVHETADRLFIHRNTLHKRLRRIEEVVTIDLHNMDDVMEVYLALRAADLLRAPASLPSLPP